MPLDNLTGDFVVFKRDENRDRYLRDYKMRIPGADTREQTQPFVDASLIADLLTPLYANCVLVAKNSSASSKSGAALIDEARSLGTDKQPAVGASGSVIIVASLGGGTIFAGDECKVNGLRYQCTATALYADGAQVPVQGIDTGPGTNQPAGTVVEWSTPRAGIGSKATVSAQADGTGLTGGHDEETDADLQGRLASRRGTPPASGNDAEYQKAILSTPGLSIEQAFTYPGIKGPGTMGFTFTLRATATSQNRIPNAAQLAQVLAHITGLFPASDGIFACVLIADPVTIALRMTWALGIPGWADLAPWPIYVSPMVQVKTGTVPTATTFKLTNIGANVAPTAGKTIAFYDAANGKFRRKRILTATLSGADYDIVCDTANSASDTTYVPLVLQPCCPWSDSLDTAVLPTTGFFAKLGPGEQKSGFFDAGLREKRSPRNPQFWPSAITNRLLQAELASSSVQDADILSPAIPRVPTVGTPGVSSYLITLQHLAAFP